MNYFENQHLPYYHCDATSTGLYQIDVFLNDSGAILPINRWFIRSYVSIAVFYI